MLLWGALGRYAWGGDDQQLVRESGKSISMSAPSNPKTHEALGQAGVQVVQMDPHSGWGLRALLRLYALPAQSHDVGMPSFAGSTRLPALLDGSFLVPERDAAAFLWDQYPDRRPGGSEAGAAAVVALCDVVLRGVDYSRYYDPLNVLRSTEPHLKRRLGFPVSYMVLGLQHAAASARVDGYNASPRMSTLRNAKEALEALEGMLTQAGGQFFGGAAGPSSADAAVFGVVAEALADLNLRKVLPHFAPLVAHFERLRERLFPGDVGSGPGLHAMDANSAFGGTLLGARRLHTEPLPSAAPAPGVPREVKQKEADARAKKEAKEPTEDEKAMAKGARVFTAAGAASVVLVMLVRLVSSLMDDDGDHDHFDHEYGGDGGEEMEEEYY